VATAMTKSRPESRTVPPADLVMTRGPFVAQLAQQARLVTFVASTQDRATGRSSGAHLLDRGTP